MDVSVLLTLAMFLALVFESPAVPGAQEGGTPVSGRTAECGLNQRFDDAEAVLNLLSAASGDANLEPLTSPERLGELPALTPVSRATLAEVIAAGNTTAACFASREPLRGLTGFSDGFLRRIIAADGPEAVRSSLSSLMAGSDEMQIPGSPVVREIESGTLADGRIAVARVIAYEFPGQDELSHLELTLLFIFVDSDTGWLLDDVLFVEVSVDSTPMP